MSCRPRPAVAPSHLPIHWLKPAGAVAHSTLSTAQVKYEWSYTSSPPYAFVVWVGTSSPPYHTPQYDLANINLTYIHRPVHILLLALFRHTQYLVYRRQIVVPSDLYRLSAIKMKLGGDMPGSKSKILLESSAKLISPFGAI